VDVFYFGFILCEIHTSRRVFVQAMAKWRIPEIPDRPFFDEPLRGFDALEFDIVPSGDSKTVRAYVRGVRDLKPTEW
jgi:hypothetical protein